MSVTMYVAGSPVTTVDGMTLTAALVRAGIRAVGVNPVSGRPRGPFCGMGICFECELFVDGRLARACVTPVCEGMVVATAGPGESGIGGGGGAAR